MNKALKVFAGSALGVGAATAGLCELIYQGVLNIPLHRKIMGTGIFNNPEEQKLWDENEILLAGRKWFDELAPKDTMLQSRLGHDIFCNIIPAEKETHNWAVVIHGYGDCPRGMSHYAWKYHTLGCNVLLPHMIGHDSDPEKYCSMGARDHILVVDWINEIVRRDPQAVIVLHGVSMGSATTMLVTGDPLPENVVAAVADCGYTSCWDEYASQIGAIFHLPVFPFLDMINFISKNVHHNFDFKECSPLEAVKRSKTPTFFVHGEADTFVPYTMMEPLYNACAAEKDKLSVPGAFHAVSAFIDNDLYWDRILAFLQKYITF